jgi:transcriptional regulator with XRE-family HTH domain
MPKDTEGGSKQVQIPRRGTKERKAEELRLMIMDTRPGQSLDDLREELLAKDPKLKEAWDALETKRRLVTSLLRLRRKANLTQRELAERAGWQPSFVSRLESFPRTGEQLFMPDVETLNRYAEACGSHLGLVFAEPKSRGNNLHVSASLGFGVSARFMDVMEVFSGADVGVKRRPQEEEVGSN